MDISAKLKYLLFIFPVLFVVLLLFLVVKVFLPRFWGGGRGTPRTVTLSYWGLFESEEVMAPLIDDYKEKYKSEHPGSEIEIKYEQRFFDNLEQYKETLKSRLSEKTGPDIMRLHVTWLPQFYEQELTFMPAAVLSPQEVSETFYPVAVESITIKDRIYALPLMYEGLMLLVNVDMFNEVGLAVPKADDRLTWGEFRELAVKLTKTEEGKIIQSGAAIGLSNNIPHAGDILGLMWAQSEVLSVADLDSRDAQIVLGFYADFSREDNVWDASFSSSIKAFAEGKTAMIFAPSWRVLQIEGLNPGLTFVSTAVPQIPGKEDVNWATFWVEGVSKDSPYQNEAWEFLKFFASSESQKRFYSSATQLEKRSFGEPYSRKDLADSLSSHKYLGALLAGAPSSKTWIITDRSGNDRYVGIINNAITAVAEDGQNPSDVLSNAKETLEQLLIQNNAILH